MNDNYFDHDADIGIMGRGNSLEESFIDAARAMYAIMGDLSHIQQEYIAEIEFEESDVELAFVTWLNSLLAQSNSNKVIFAHFKLSKEGNNWHGQAFGQRWQDSMERGIDVKGATLTMLSVKQLNGQWEARCVIDV